MAEEDRDNNNSHSGAATRCRHDDCSNATHESSPNHNQDGDSSHSSHSRRSDDSRPADDDDDDDSSGVWTGFEQSVAYLKQVAAIYHESFGGGARTGSGIRTAVPRTSTKITTTRVHEAQQQAREALELLASNLLNASTAIVKSLEVQVSGEVCVSSAVCRSLVAVVG